ncbi:DUF779 domain-containing protein [Ornithinimicrobium sp. Arc0846-15]|nr:DUF779 domain-containing protein [Ornithinimicrobium laminariae]
MSQPNPSRVAITAEAGALIAKLVDRNGPVMFHQSGGCCDGSSPMCYPLGDFITGDSDVLLAEVKVADVKKAVPIWMSKSQFAYWKHTHLTIDVVKGRGAGFSLEAPEGKRFLIRSRLLTDDEDSYFAEQESLAN